MDAVVDRTAAEAAWLAAMEEATDRLPWLADARRTAVEAFARSGLPHRRLEDWKWTDLRRLIDGTYPPARPGKADAATVAGLLARAPLKDIARCRLVFVDGRFDAALSGRPADAGIEFVSLGGGERPDWLAVDPREGDPLEALNIAQVEDGAAIRVAAGTRPQGPVDLCFVTTLAEPATVATRNVVVVEAEASLTLFETHLGGAGVSSSSTEVRLARGARLERVKIQAEDRRSIHLANLLATLGEGADFADFTLTTGGRLTRQQGFVTLAGEHATARIAGAYLIAGRQHADTRLVVDHAVPHGASRELFKCVMDGEARGVFQGKVIVRPGAQKTDGKQSSHGLLLAPTAEFDAKPELEIFADDVVCGHGATSGEIDEDQLFYLRARGIGEAEAKSLLVAAFVGEAIEAVESEPVREVLTGIAAGWLAEHGKAHP